MINSFLKKNKSKILKYLSLYPPYLGAGIKVKHMASDFRSATVEMNLNFWNRNYVGTHFGGSLYSMVDPFFMLMLIENLGGEYIVWDKGAEINFKTPGTGKVFAEFVLTSEEISDIKMSLLDCSKVYPEFNVDIKNTEGQVVASVKKILYVSKKNKS